MPWFIKTETFKKQTLALPHQSRQEFVRKHLEWVMGLKRKGINITSGYLIDENKVPGGGGLLILQANSFEEAQSLIKSDPIIISGLVSWQLQEWIPVA